MFRRPPPPPGALGYLPPPGSLPPGPLHPRNLPSSLAGTSLRGCLSLVYCHVLILNVCLYFILMFATTVKTEGNCNSDFRFCFFEMIRC